MMSRNSLLHTRLKFKIWKKICSVNTNEKKSGIKKSGVLTLILDKADFEANKIIKENQEHYRKIKWSRHNEDILNGYTPKGRASNT